MADKKDCGCGCGCVPPGKTGESKPETEKPEAEKKKIPEERKK